MSGGRSETSKLSPREFEIARLYAKGLSYKAVAERLVIAPATVRTHLATIYRKLEIGSKMELVRALSAEEMVEPDATARAVALPVPPVIAILPFVSLSSEGDQRFFADGLAEDIITRLSYLRGVDVVSRTASFVFRDAPKTITEISREVGARYILEGSVRASKERVRVIANLVDGETSISLWSERFDRELTDLFEIQDEITHAVVVALQVKLSDGEMALDPGGTTDYEAWATFQKGALLHLTYTGEGLLQARRHYARAIEMDSAYLDARIFQAWTYWQRGRSGFSSDPQRALAECRRQLDEMLAAGPMNANLRHLEAATLVLERRWEEALAAADRAIAIGPSKLFGYTPSALARIYSGEFQAAADILRETIRTVPATPNDTIYNLANVLLLMGDHAKALQLAEEYMRRVPSDLFAYLLLTHAYSFAGSEERARQTIARFHELFPGYRLSDYEAHEPFKDREIIDMLLDRLRSAGLPE